MSAQSLKLRRAQYKRKPQQKKNRHCAIIMSRRSKKQQRQTKTAKAWAPPSSEAQRRVALGKFFRPVALVAACQEIPPQPRFCQECSSKENSDYEGSKYNGQQQQYQLRQQQESSIKNSLCACCPHSTHQPGYFVPKTRPKPGEWLADGMPGESERKGQSYKDFLAFWRRKPSPTCQTIYLCNLDEDATVTTKSDETAAQQKIMKVLRSFVQAYFQMPCRIMEPLTHTERKKLVGRNNPFDSQFQLLTGPIDSILSQRLQQHPGAFAVAGVTLVDLYPDEYWIGQAMPDKGVGIFSFARYSEAFYNRLPASGNSANHLAWPKDPLGNSGDQLLLLRAMKTLAHELLHLLGLAHCVYYQCVMNGSNGLEESDASPLHLCPVCLRKLHHSVAWTGQPLDITRRYHNLSLGMKQLGLLQ
mmetsp:Transcript_28403/g.78003  ORF Transcript_28403/g.78003 Transcript_28403/m.78003 type:complete len:416 (-) Transcript_28403:1434-2681(-)